MNAPRVALLNTISVLPVPGSVPMKVPTPVPRLIENSCALLVAPYNPSAAGPGVGVGVGVGGGVGERHTASTEALK